MTDARLKKAAFAFTAAVMTFTAGDAHSSSFDFDQFFSVSDPLFRGSQNLIYYYNTAESIVTPFQYGDYVFYYSLPFEANLGLFHYSYQDGRFNEGVYLNDYAL